jgi:hypothetical protein
MRLAGHDRGLDRVPQIASAVNSHSLDATGSGERRKVWIVWLTISRMAELGR